MSKAEKFKLFLQDKSMPLSQKNKLLRQYAKSLGMKGSGKKSGAKLVPMILQGGGSWGSFTSWIRNAGRTVGNAVANAGKTVCNRTLKPAGEAVYNEVKNKPLSTLGKVAGLAGMIPSPFAPGLRTAGTALTAVGSAVGKGQAGGAIARNAHGKTIMYF